METRKSQFTGKELQVIQMLLEGKSNSQIALELGVTTRAVEQRLTHIYGKLEVNSRAEAIIRLIHLFEK
ncbi:MAG: helix-turn-helix transcriptional regulator [Anaerolineales bacterium]|nr:helix-turn-helix transcriptional regulator [Anaerolineales bacterium]